MADFDYNQSSWLFDEIRQYLPANTKIVGNDVNFPCPFCDETHTAKKRGTKRGHYYIDTQSYWCFRCETYVHGLKLYSMLSGNPVEDIKPEYYRYKYSEKNIRATVENIKNTVDKFTISYHELPDILKYELPQSAIEELTRRKIYEAPFLPKDYKFYYAKSKTTDYIVIPWLYNDLEFYYQLRTLSGPSASKYLFPKNLRKAIFGLDSIDPGFPYVVCFEGVFDSIFVKNGIAIGGKYLTPYQKWIISSRYPKHKIVFSFDNDPAGVNATKKILATNSNYYFLDWFGESNGCKDINDYVMKTGENPFKDENFIKSHIISGLKMQLSLNKSF